MAIEDRLPSSRKRSLLVDSNDVDADVELCYRSTPSVTAENGLQHEDQSLITEASDFEQSRSRKRMRTSEGNRGTWAVSPQGAGSRTDRDLYLESCKTESAVSPLEATPLADAAPYVSFGEGADPIFKRIMTATHKCIYALDSNKLLCRLNDLPKENEYIPRKMYDLTSTPHSTRTPDSGATATPSSDYWQSPPAEVKIENERRLTRMKERVREGRVIWAIQRADDPSLASPKSNCDQNPTLFNGNATFPRDLHLSPLQIMKKQIRPNVVPRARGTAWEGRLRQFCREGEKIESGLAHRCQHIESVAVGRLNSKKINRRKSKKDYSHKNVGVYMTPGSEDLAGRSTIEEHRWNFAQQSRGRNAYNILDEDEPEGKLLARLPNSYATPSRSPPKSRVRQRHK